MADLDCGGRLFYLMNHTIAVRDSLRAYHTELLGVAGLFLELLRRVPEENSWLWLLLTAQERTLQKLHTYWSRVSALALDQHHCLVVDVRNVVLEATVRWRTLYADLAAKWWDGFAFGLRGRRQTSCGAGKQLSASPSGETSETAAHFMSGSVWMTVLREWFDEYAQKLYAAMVTLEGALTQQPGATRLHHQDEHGSFVTYEFMRRKVFGQWAIDKGLIRGLLRHVWQPGNRASDPVTVADFGAGGGHYSTWMNETGLIHAFAFDGTRQAAELTDGVVQEVNLIQDLRLWRTFDWVLCLEVGEHVPRQYSAALLQNLKGHAENGLIMSWSDDWEGIGHVNCLPRAEFVDFVQNTTGFQFDETTTEVVKASCEIDYIARTLAVFRKPS